MGETQSGTGDDSFINNVKSIERLIIFDRVKKITKRRFGWFIESDKLDHETKIFAGKLLMEILEEFRVA